MIRATSQSFNVFQSSPLSQEGRYPRILASPPPPLCFNPRPSRKRGATRFVDDERSRIACFNPRPSRKRGATVFNEPLPRFVVVSILAPLARGALLLICMPEKYFDFSFNPRPSRKRGATSDPENVGTGSDCFNPRPSRKRGATRPCATPRRVGRRFNPRPSRKRGATLSLTAMSQ